VSRRQRALTLAAALAIVAAVSSAAAAFRADRFDHAEHQKLFVSCQTCHFPGNDFSAAVWPRPEACAGCHDGTVEEPVNWKPPDNPPPSNLRFTHAGHADKVRQDAGRDSSVACTACHSERGAPWMRVERAVVTNCLSCHGTPGPHLAVADTACATCHVPLWEAPRLAAARIAKWPAPPSHRQPEFATTGHGDLARSRDEVAASCATCHARDYCITCHVNAPEEVAIQALQPDRRSLAMHVSKLKAPTSHRRRDFLQRHGTLIDEGNAGGRCMVCHTQESCAACHIAPPGTVRALPAAGPGRGAGAKVERKRPATHGVDYSDAHAAPAAAATQSCAGCHTREQCLDCHRPNAAARAGYHPGDFLSRHPVAAYAQEVSCGSCHNTSQFCQTCHQQSGIVASGPIGGKADFHDAKQFFAAGHGDAARQSLESCVSCHSERDCMSCHSAQTRRFNPHGPGFDAERLRKRNSQMCSACHGAAIPGG
jgi:hypothetical protein